MYHFFIIMNFTLEAENRMAVQDSEPVRLRSVLENEWNLIALSAKGKMAQTDSCMQSESNIKTPNF